jgi:hypothetical protein
MGQVLHGSATTTEAIRRAIQDSQESLRALAKRYGINQKTVAKWKKRPSVADAPTGPKNPVSTVLTIEEEAVIVAFRRHTLLPLDDCLYALQPTIPNLTRSSLHRCLQRHGISRLPEVEGDKPAKKKFKPYPIGYFHIDIAEVQTAEGKLHLFVAIDRTSKFAYVELHKRATKMIAAEFLRHLMAAVPYQIHTVLTDNGIQFKNREQDRTAMEHIFGRTCRENGIEHRTTKVKHPWTNGQVESLNRTIKEATVRRFHYDCHRSASKPPVRLHRSLQFRPSPQDPQGALASRVHLQTMDNRAAKIQVQSAPSNAGTKHPRASSVLTRSELAPSLY